MAKRALPHYVYYLYTHDLTNELVDVGRSKWPHRRRLIKERKHGIKLRMQISEPITSLATACAYEVAEIRALRPRFNVLVQSSPGSTGKPVNAGVPKSALTRARISASKKGVPGRAKTDSEREHLRLLYTGVPLSKEHARKIGAAQRGELNHMYGKTRSLEARKKTSESCKKILANPDVKKRQSEGLKKAWREGKFTNMLLNRTRKEN